MIIRNFVKQANGDLIAVDHEKAVTEVVDLKKYTYRLLDDNHTWGWVQNLPEPEPEVYTYYPPESEKYILSLLAKV